MPGFIGVVDYCLKEDALGEALKLMRHLEQLHTGVPEKLQSKDHRRQIKHVEKLFGEKIKRIKDLLRNPKNKENFSRLRKFFENPANNSKDDE